MLVWIVDAGLQAASLFLVGDVEEELEDEDVVVGEHGLELDMSSRCWWTFLREHELVDAGDEDVFVVGAVEDADHAARGTGGVGAPEEVVTSFERRGDFERRRRRSPAG